MGSSVSLLWADIEGTVDFIASEAINRGTCKIQWFLTLPVETGREGGESPANASKRLLRAVHSNFSNLEYISKFVAKPGHFGFIYVLISFVSFEVFSTLLCVSLFITGIMDLKFVTVVIPPNKHWAPGLGEQGGKMRIWEGKGWR